MRNIFITGGTGFLGSNLITEINNLTTCKVHAIVRGRNIALAKKRLLKILKELSYSSDLFEKTKANLQVHIGDLGKNDLGLTDKTRETIRQNVDIVYHCAATTDFNVPINEARENNVIGTRRVLDFFASSMPRDRRVKINHVSTMYVAGTHTGAFRENDLDVYQDFHNTYEQSKFEAEQIVGLYREKGMQIDVFRPSIILGRYRDGKTNRFKMLYQPLRFFASELIKQIPFVSRSRAYMVNVDIAARAIFLLGKKIESQNRNYHITSPVGVNLKEVLGEASSCFGFNLPEFVDLSEINMAHALTPTQRKMLEPYLPYFNCQTQFSLEETEDALAEEGVVLPNFDKRNLKRLFEYCKAVGFIKRSKDNAAKK